MAIKCLKMNVGDSERVFKVSTFNRPRALPLLSSLSAVMSRDNRLERLGPSEHPASVRGLYVHKPTLFPYFYRLDAQWEFDAVCKIKSRSKPLAIGEPASCPPAIFHLAHQQSVAL